MYSCLCACSIKLPSHNKPGELQNELFMALLLASRRSSCCSILIADASLSWLRVREQRGQKLWHLGQMQNMNPSQDRLCRRQQRGQGSQTEKCSQVEQCLSELRVISGVRVKSSSEDFLLFWSLAAREWQGALFVAKSTLSAGTMLDSNQYRNYQLRAYLSLFSCASAYAPVYCVLV